MRFGNRWWSWDRNLLLNVINVKSSQVALMRTIFLTVISYQTILQPPFHELNGMVHPCCVEGGNRTTQLPDSNCHKSMWSDMSQKLLVKEPWNDSWSEKLQKVTLKLVLKFMILHMYLQILLSSTELGMSQERLVRRRQCLCRGKGSTG